ncbi:hypothetical protein ACCQ13_00405 [Xanthomonas sp. NCPPB 1638]|uniref:hypothetical protein n=1 Tax=Xanthomonas TaxID=338 RepID=UPI00236838A6|nr:hypothetical protein [Xanthomonas cucurbitae]WDM75561.1 hypothetical protein K6982_00395 [Xanthomonas cucurbitae]
MYWNDLGYHYVCCLLQEHASVSIMALLHERMDLMVHFAGRLSLTIHIAMV